ncbi:MAG: DUF1573 domain-containing protein [Rikenellaceae bacterium]
MKKTLFIALCLLSVACTSQTRKQGATVVSTSVKSVTNTEAPFIIGEGSVPGSEPLGTKNIGVINEGEVLEVSFNIKNNREIPLIIFNAKASCGCTSVSYDAEPIKKGETRAINVTYNSKGKSGQQMVFINLLTDDGDYTIRLNLFVKK